MCLLKVFITIHVNEFNSIMIDMELMFEYDDDEVSEYANQLFVGHFSQIGIFY